MDAVVARADVHRAAENRHVIVAVDAVVHRVDVQRHVAADNQAAVVARLDAVLRVPVDRQRAVTCEERHRVRFHFDCRAVIGIRDLRVGGIFVVRVFVVGQAGDDHLHLGLLVDRKRRATGAGQVEIIQNQNHAGGPFLDRDAAVRGRASDNICAGFVDLDGAVFADIVGRGVLIIRREGHRAIRRGSAHNRGGRADRGLRRAVLHSAKRSTLLGVLAGRELLATGLLRASLLAGAWHTALLIGILVSSGHGGLLAAALYRELLAVVLQAILVSAG